MSKCSTLRTALLCTAGVVFLTSAALGQQATSTESVVVTGSRVITDLTNSPTPITAVSTDELAATSPIDLPDALNKLPVFLGSSAPAATDSAANGAGGNTLNLRNFGAQRTLVLFDGHRQPPSNTDGTVIIDTLPQMLIQRVDIVTGGASAVYGSDAVTGVVNFVIDKRFNGIKVNASAGISNFGDGAQQQFGIAAGTDLFGGKGHWEGSLRYYHLDPILLNARKWGPETAWEVEGAGTQAQPLVNVEHATLTAFSYGGKITCTGCAANNQQFIQNGVIGPFQLGTPTAASNITSGGDGVVNQAASLQVGQITYQAFQRFSYDINETTNFYIQGIAAQSWTSGYHVNNYVQTGANPNIVYNNNAFLTPAAQALVTTGNRNPTFTDAQYFQFPYYDANLDTQLNRNLGISAGLDGVLFGKFAWDLYYGHGENRLKFDSPNDQSNAKIAAAMDAVVNPANGQIVCQVSLTAFSNLYPGCVPLNRFGPTAATPTMYNYILVDTWNTTSQVLDDFSGSISGEIFDLPAGPLKAALNGEYRELTYRVDASPNALPGTVDCTGLRLTCVAGMAQTQHSVTLGLPVVSENVWEFAGEVDAPLLKGLPMIQTLDLNLAGRYTNYSISGPVQTWKIGVDWHLDDMFHLRGTTSTDIRAPTMNDLYRPQTISHSGFTDVHTGNQIQQATNISQGNASLQPEVARTWTVGGVFTPDFISGLTLSLDYYQIVLKNAITSINGSTAGVQQVCEASNGTSPLCALFVRPLPFSDRSLANYPTAVLSQTLNAALNKTSGVDLEMDYGFDLKEVVEEAPGSIMLRLFADYQPQTSLSSFPGAPVTQPPVPKGRFTSIINYKLGSWSFDVTDRYYTEFQRTTQPGVLFYADPYGKALNYIDLNIEKEFDIDGNSVDWFFHIKNLINTPPPIEPDNSTVPGGSPYGGHLSTGGGIGGVDNVGRYFTIGVRARM
jgi:outer membrane receptor protein involved in Fe transport